MFTRLLRLSIIVSLITILAIVLTRQVGAQRQRDWLAFEGAANDTNSVYVLDVPLKILFNTARWLKPDGCNLSMPAWSNDGRLALVLACDPILDLLILDLRTVQISRFTDDVAFEYFPTWSNDGRLAFIAWREGSAYLYIGDPQTGAISPVPTAYKQLYPPLWSSDGKLAFLGSPSSGMQEFVDLWVRSVDGTLSRIASGFTIPTLTWSPDGSRLVYTRPTNGGANDLMLVDLRSGDTRNLTNSAADEYRPFWLPDGRLSYSSANGSIINTYLLNVDSGDLTTLPHENIPNGSASWSADGRHNLYVNFRSRVSDLTIVDLDTGAQNHLRLKLQIVGSVAWPG